MICSRRDHDRIPVAGHVFLFPIEDKLDLAILLRSFFGINIRFFDITIIPRKSGKK